MDLVTRTAVIAIVTFLVTGVYSSESLKTVKFPPCKSCRVFTESVKKNIEVDFTTMEKKLCQEVVAGRDQCISLKKEYGSFLKKWWEREDRPEVFQHLCVDELRLCCPENHFGPNCTRCDGYPDNVCNNNGKCKGAGTRKGNGKCYCDKGYTNEKCDQCVSGYFEAYRDENKLLCTKCHPSCKGPCTKPGPEGCQECNPGWLTTKDKVCMDINECAAPESPCMINQFCVNNEGSFRCLNCDSSCHSCTGDGPDMCKKCAKGFVKKDKMCVDETRENKIVWMYVTRYLTYLGLCVCTCIIFNKNTVLAAIIGIIVAVYISTSEYVLNTHPTPKTDNLAQSIMNKISR